MRRIRSEGEREEKEEESRGRETDCVPRACKLETSASRRGYVLGGLYDPEGAEILAWASCAKKRGVSRYPLSKISTLLYFYAFPTTALRRPSFRHFNQVRHCCCCSCLIANSAIVMPARFSSGMSTICALTSVITICFNSFRLGTDLRGNRLFL